MGERQQRAAGRNVSVNPACRGDSVIAIGRLTRQRQTKRRTVSFRVVFRGRGDIGGCSEGAAGRNVGLCGGRDENLWEGLHGGGWVGDAVVEDDDGSGGEICRYELGDVPDGRMQRIARLKPTATGMLAVLVRRAEAQPLHWESEMVAG